MTQPLWPLPVSGLAGALRAFGTPTSLLLRALFCALFAALFTALFTAPVATAQSPAPPQSGPPKAVLSEVIYDFGKVVRADVAKKSFEIRNEGGSTLEIREVQTTCACTVVDYPRSLLPGARGEITVAIDTDFVDGAYQAQAVLFTNDPAKPKIDLTFKIETQPYISAQPGYIRYNVYQYFPESFDPVVRQRVWAEKPNQIEITSIESPYDFIETTFREAADSERDPKHDGRQWTIETKIRRDAPIGPLAGYLRVHTNHDKQGKLSIPISGFVRPLFAVTPAELDMGELEIQGEPLTTSLHVQHFLPEPTLAVTRVDTDIAGLVLDLEPIEEGRAYWIRITVPANMPKGPFSGTVQIHTNSQDQPVVVAPVRGRAK